MKTPREILFARHRDAMPELNAISAQVIGQLNERQPFSWKGLWESLRWQRVALASAWVLVLLLQLASRGSSPADAVDLPAKTLAVKENRLLIRELLNPAATDVVLAPGPRTDFINTQLRG